MPVLQSTKLYVSYQRGGYVGEDVFVPFYCCDGLSLEEAAALVSALGCMHDPEVEKEDWLEFRLEPSAAENPGRFLASQAQYDEFKERLVDPDNDGVEFYDRIWKEIVVAERIQKNIIDARVPKLPVFYLRHEGTAFLKIEDLTWPEFRSLLEMMEGSAPGDIDYVTNDAADFGQVIWPPKEHDLITGIALAENDLAMWDDISTPELDRAERTAREYIELVKLASASIFYNEPDEPVETAVDAPDAIDADVPASRRAEPEYFILSDGLAVFSVNRHYPNDDSDDKPFTREELEAIVAMMNSDLRMSIAPSVITLLASNDGAPNDPDFARRWSDASRQTKERIARHCNYGEDLNADAVYGAFEHFSDEVYKIRELKCSAEMKQLTLHSLVKTVESDTSKTQSRREQRAIAGTAFVLWKGVAIEAINSPEECLTSDELLSSADVTTLVWALNEVFKQDALFNSEGIAAPVSLICDGAHGWEKAKDEFLSFWRVEQPDHAELQVKLKVHGAVSTLSQMLNSQRRQSQTPDEFMTDVAAIIVTLKSLFTKELMRWNSSAYVAPALSTIETKGPRGMSREEANVRCREFLAKHFKNNINAKFPGQRTIAREVGCSASLICELESYKAVRERHTQTVTLAAAKGITLTNDLASVIVAADSPNAQKCHPSGVVRTRERSRALSPSET